MMDTFQPQAVKLHYHGETFDTKQEIHEISDAWLIAADVVGTYSDDWLVFYDTGRLEKKSDGYHLYENNYPRFFTVDTPKVGADLRKIDVSELAGMSFTDFVRIGFSLGGGFTMMQYTVSKAAVKKATARLGLSKAQAQNVLPKYAQGASFVWSLESTNGDQSVYDNPREQVRLVIAENGTILDVFPADYALQSPQALSDDVLQTLKEATRNALIAERDAVHRKWCEIEVDFHANSYEIAKVRLALTDAADDEQVELNRKLAQLCPENKRLHNERSALRKERTEIERALVPYI